MKRLWIMAFCFVLSLSSSLIAGPVVPAEIDAEAVWYGHFDMESVMQLPMLQKAHEKALTKKWSGNHWKNFCRQIGMKLMGEFLSATMYATQYEGDFGVVIMKFKSDLPQENLHAIFAQRFPKHEELQIGTRKAYSWTMKCGRKKMRMTGCFINKRQILLGMDEQHVRNALAVIDGRRESISENHRLFKGLTPGVIFISRAIDVPQTYQFSTYCPVLKHCQEAFARWTVFGNEIRGRYEFQTMDRETAGLYQQAIEGMKAIFLLRFRDHDQVLPLINGFSNIDEGKAVILTWEGNVEELEKAAKQIRVIRRAQRKKRRQDNKK